MDCLWAELGLLRSNSSKYSPHPINQSYGNASPHSEQGIFKGFCALIPCYLVGRAEYQLIAGQFYQHESGRTRQPPTPAAIQIGAPLKIAALSGQGNQGVRQMPATYIKLGIYPHGPVAPNRPGIGLAFQSRYFSEKYYYV